MTDFFTFIGEQWLLVSLLIGLIYLLAFTEKRKSGRLVSSLQIAPLVNSEGGVVVDIRDAADFRAGHIVDSINIPHAKVAERLGELEKYKNNPVIIACKMGQHSASTGRTLKAEGFTQVCRLEGGIEDWRNSQLPLVKD